MTRVERLEAGPFVEGCRVRVEQPKLPAMTWEVTDYERGRAFSWTAKRPGLTSVASHEVAAAGERRTRVTLRIEQSGWLAWAVRPFYGGLTRRYMRMEAEGLKRRAEGGGGSGAAAQN
jgi:hypothetical protein